MVEESEVRGLEDKRKYGHGTPVKKLVLNQFGAAVLGIMLFMASRNSVPMSLFTGIFTACFYMVIDYTSMWDIGARDRIRVDGGRAEKDLFTATKAALLAGIPNIILGLGCTLFTAFDSMENSVVILCRNIAIMWESMYSGILWVIFPKTLHVVDGVANYAYDVVANPGGTLYMSLYLVIVIPAVAAATLGYIAGFNNFRIIKRKKDEK